MELSPEQIYMVGLFAAILAALIRYIVKKVNGPKLSKLWMSIIAAACALGIAVVFKLPEVPAYQDPLQLVGAWLTIITGYVGAATVIYNLILDKLLEAGAKVAKRILA